MAYATKMAAALSGATLHQLRHWRSPKTGPLLAPEIASAPRALYSFQDVLALRTFVKLRENASLQKIRAAVLPDAKGAGYDVLITRDRSQLSDPRECDAIKKSGLRHVRYTQRHEGMRGLALALGAVIAAMPMVMQDLVEADSQRLVEIVALEQRRRFNILDPQRTPPSAYWSR